MSRGRPQSFTLATVQRLRRLGEMSLEMQLGPRSSRAKYGVWLYPGGNGDPLKVWAQRRDVIRTVLQRETSQWGIRSTGEGGWEAAASPLLTDGSFPSNVLTPTAHQALRVELEVKKEHELSQSLLSGGLQSSSGDITTEISTPERGMRTNNGGEGALGVKEAYEDEAAQIQGRMAGLGRRCMGGVWSKGPWLETVLKKRLEQREQGREGGRRGWGGGRVWVLYPKTRGKQEW